MRTSLVVPREAFDSVFKPLKKRARGDKLRPSRPLLLPLLLCVPLVLTLWSISAELSLLTPGFTTISAVQRILNDAEESSPVLDSTDESLLFNATFYPEDLFKTDWSKHIKASDILHESALHRGCVNHKNSIIPWTFGRVGQSQSEELDELVHRNDSDLLERLRRCPDVDILLPDHLRSFGYCEDAAAYTKFLESRMLPHMMEGYGHYINQARSANAFIITTDAAPMNELITPSSGALVKARTIAYGEQFMGGVSDKEHALRNISGLVAKFEREDVCDAVVNLLKNSTSEERELRANRALQQYYFDTVFFAHKMNELRTFARAMSHPSLRGKILNGGSSIA
ncbi:hypothetical protein PRNP1_012589 [Phytophthora ramorum]